MRHDTARADHRPSANCHTAADGRIGANTGALTHQRRDLLGMVDPGPGEQIIGEYRVRADKNVIFEGNPGPNGDAILYDDAISDARARLDEAMITDVTPAPDHGLLHHVRKRPDAGLGADIFRLDNCRGVAEELHDTYALSPRIFGRQYSGYRGQEDADISVERAAGDIL